MANDEIGDIRKIRHQISEECGHDIHKIAAYYREVEKELKASGKFHFEPSRGDETDAERRSAKAPSNKRMHASVQGKTTSRSVSRTSLSLNVAITFVNVATCSLFLIGSMIGLSK